MKEDGLSVELTGEDQRAPPVTSASSSHRTAECTGASPATEKPVTPSTSPSPVKSDRINRPDEGQRRTLSQSYSPFHFGEIKTKI